MSGGVDSSVAAALLVREGYDVTGVMLKLWSGDAINNLSGCCNIGAADDARRVADVLGIPFYVFNFADRFTSSVVRNFKEDYSAGRTPNPCVRCNQWIKFDALFDKARALGADVLATGHYARVRHKAGRYKLLRGVDTQKDQSYVLWMLAQEHLKHCRFPVGEMPKSETRRIAAELGLRTARKPDSQEICFVRGGDFDAYVGEHLAEASRPGPILTSQGTEIGRHRGIGRYTVGQRKGLGISLGVPVFVHTIDADANAIVVGGRDELYVDGFVAEEASFTSGDAPPDGTPVLVQHRAHGDVRGGSIHQAGAGRFEVHYDNPVAAVAPGQSATLYSAESPDEVLGGGIVLSTARVAAGV